MRAGELLHVSRADGDARGQLERRRNRRALAPADLQAVANLGNRRELAAVAGDDRRNTEAPGRGRCHESGRERPVAVNDIEGSVVFQRAEERGVLAQRAGRPSKVADGRAKEWIAAGPLVVAKGVDEYVVLPGQPFDQPEDGGNHFVATASIDAAGHDESDAHPRPLFHTLFNGPW